MPAGAIAIPQGPVFGPLRITYLGPTGGVRHHEWPARRWSTCAIAMDIGHRLAAEHRIGTYAIELEIVRQGDAEAA